MLTPEELSSLLSILTPPNGSFGEVLQLFRQHVPKQSQFKFLCALALLVQSETLGPSQRLFSLWLIAHAMKHDSPSSNPFLPVLVELFQAREPKSAEHMLLHALLHNTDPKKINECSATDCLPILEEILNANGPPDIKSLQEAFDESLAPLESLLDPVGIGAPVDLPTAASSSSSPPSSHDLAGRLEMAPLMPQHVRPAPPLLAPLTFEMKWLHMDRSRELLWDDGGGADALAAKPAIERLMQEALTKPLPEAHASALVQVIRTEPSLIQECGLVPARLPDIVEHNPTIATEVLLMLMNSSDIAKYLQVFVSMPMSLHSMEVVNRLTTSVELPPEFVHHYISNCITTCAHVKDRFTQHRLVRLVCVFLQALIRNNTIDVKDLIGEVQSFCIEFSKVKEAVGLYRLLKSIESKQSGEGK